MGNIARRVVRVFIDMSLLKKLTLAYTVAILIPTVAVGMYAYRQSEREINNEFIKSTQNTLEQIKGNISLKVLNAENISHNIAYNSKIQDFLQREFNLTPNTLHNYKKIIAKLLNISYK